MSEAWNLLTWSISNQKAQPVKTEVQDYTRTRIQVSFNPSLLQQQEPFRDFVNS